MKKFSKLKSRDEIISRFARLYPRKMEFDNILSEYSETQEISWGSMSPHPFTTLRLRRSFRKSVSIDPRSAPGTSYSILLQCASFEHCLSSGCKGSQTRGPYSWKIRVGWLCGMGSETIMWFFFLPCPGPLLIRWNVWNIQLTSDYNDRTWKGVF